MTTQHLTHFVARCHNCSAECTAKNAQAWAHNHSRKTGHNVDLSLGYVVKPGDAPIVRMFTELEVVHQAIQLPKYKASPPEEVRARINARRREAKR